MNTILMRRNGAGLAGGNVKAPGVVVSHTTDPDIQSGRKFLDQGLQTAADVPLQCDEGADFITFRVRLFGLEKWHQVERTVGQLAAALEGLGVVATVGGRLLAEDWLSAS